MKTNSLFKVVFFVIIAGLISLSCSPADTSKVTIHINLGLHNQSAVNIHKDTIMDRVFRFFVREAKAQIAPDGITSFGLTISGEGMIAINGTYTADTTIITLDVSAGPARVFQLTAYRPLGNYGGSATQDLTAGASVDIPISMAMQYANVTINPEFPNGTPASTTLSYSINVTTSGQSVTSTGVVSGYTAGSSIVMPNVPSGDAKDFEVLINTPSVTFRGTASVNLAADSSQPIAPDMVLYETKIVIPDWYNGRIVQIDDMSGNGWTEITITYPLDVDFDTQGRIYISNNNRIYRVNDINDTLVEYKFFDNANFYAIAVDSNNNKIYYYRVDTPLLLYSYSLSIIVPNDHTSQFTLPGITFTSVRGLAVDNNGNLYIAATTGSGERVIKYDPISTEVIQYSTDILKPWDVVVKNGNLYVADYDDMSPYDSSKIVQLSLDLGYSDQLGTAGSSTFYGPHRFLAILNNRFYLIDENEASESETERIAAFDSLRSPIIGFDPLMAVPPQSQFRFFNFC